MMLRRRGRRLKYFAIIILRKKLDAIPAQTSLLSCEVQIRMRGMRGIAKSYYTIVVKLMVRLANSRTEGQSVAIYLELICCCWTELGSLLAIFHFISRWRDTRTVAAEEMRFIITLLENDVDTSGRDWNIPIPMFRRWSGRWLRAANRQNCLFRFVEEESLLWVMDLTPRATACHIFF